MANWFKMEIAVEGGGFVEAPINLDLIVTYAPLSQDNFPDAKSVLYPAGGYLQTIPVRHTTEVLDELMEKEL